MLFYRNYGFNENIGDLVNKGIIPEITAAVFNKLRTD